MSLGNLLLQPQRLQRETGNDPKLEIVQDLMRLMTLLAEDAADSGPLSGVMPELMLRFSNRIQNQAESGISSVYDALKAHLHPLFLYFEGLVDDITDLDEDPNALLDIFRQIISDLQSVLNAIDQAQLKSQLDFAKELLEEHLSINPEFINQQIGALFDDLVTLWQEALPTSDILPKHRRRRRLAINILQRLRRHLVDQFTLPEINTARAASQLYNLLRSSGMREIMAEIHCVLDRFNEAVEAVDEIRTALPLEVRGKSLGAAFIQPKGSAVYCWYASWLLSDIDLPLLGTGDIKDKKRFAINLRMRTSMIKKQAAVSKYIVSTLSAEQQQQLMGYPAGSTEPDESLILMLVAHINKLMQQGPIYTSSRFNSAHANQSEQNLNRLPFEFRLREDERFTLSEDLEELSNEYVDKQDLYLYNRRFLEWIYGKDLINELYHGFWRYVGRKTISTRRDVFISGDGRYLMCDDKPLYNVAEGEKLKWQDAPLFIDKESGRSPVRGATYYRFERVSANACDILAQVLYTLEQTGRPIWHLLELQPKHEIGTGVLSGLDILHALNIILLGKPISGYESLGGWGSWLANDYYGPRGLALLGGSFQGLHTEATAGNSWWFWVTVVLGDFIRSMGHNSMLRTGRDFVLSFFTLLNASPSNSGDSSLPSNPAANHLKQEGITSPMNTFFAYLLLLNYKRENHSIEIWSTANISDRRKHAFGLWLGGGIGFGILSGISGSLVSQITAWQEDWKLLGITVLESTGYIVLGYWFFEYLFKEGDTDDGKLAQTGSYKGYPAKTSSPYRLPFAAGEALYMGQGNNGMFSHNEITNMGGSWQIYAFDLGHDHRQIIHAMRGGVVWSFDDSFADNNDQNANFIIIQHNTLVPDHDDPFGTGTTMMTYARYWHGAQNGVTNILGSGVIQESTTPRSGTVINQGDPIMEADDTGTSFHSHLHVYVVTGNASGPGSNSIPFVFEDVDNDSGLMKFLTWYRAGG
ncbi:MAG: hypothetical protein D3925_16360 [Candidatus Electrothrix sp. AR5]|nr:hypothetical protein [Candidatus Electrothrix sp. AR5]